MSNESLNYSAINSTILREAMSGSCDSLGPTDINWKAAGKYGFVLITDYTGKWWYRIFVVDDNFKYKREKILNSISDDRDVEYVYGYYVDNEGSERTLQKFEKGDWLQNVENNPVSEDEGL